MVGANTRAVAACVSLTDVPVGSDFGLRCLGITIYAAREGRRYIQQDRSLRREVGADGELPEVVGHRVPGTHAVEELLAFEPLVAVLPQGVELDGLAVLEDEGTNHTVGLEQVPLASPTFARFEKIA